MNTKVKGLKDVIVVVEQLNPRQLISTQPDCSKKSERELSLTSSTKSKSKQPAQTSRSQYDPQPSQPQILKNSRDNEKKGSSNGLTAPDHESWLTNQLNSLDDSLSSSPPSPEVSQ